MNLVASHSRHKLEKRENTEKTVSVEMEEVDETAVPCNIRQEQIAPIRQSSLPICSEEETLFEELDDAAISMPILTQTHARTSSAPLPEDREVALKKNCERSLRRMSMGSNIVTKEKSILHESNHSYRFSPQDVEEGPVLGQGSFAYVRQGSIRNIDIQSSCSSRNLRNHGEESMDCDGNSEDEMDDGTLTELNQGNYYAVKKLRQDLSDSRRVHGAIDLAREAQFLMALSHPHIVGFNGVGNDPGTSGFFILIEKLNKTLTSEIALWRAQSAYLDKNAMNIKIVDYAHKIASALSYLHSKNMIYRDLKPDNVGFNAKGDIKLFDLGLAKELLDDRKVKEDEFILSLAGTGRYMAPEVLSGKLYGLPADTFSFSLLFWQMLHQDTPFKDLNARQHRRGLLMWKTRPKISKKIPSAVKKIVKKGWEHKPKKRLRMKNIERLLHEYLHE